MTHPMFSQEEVDTYACLLPHTVKAKDTIFGKIYIHLEDGLVSFHQRWRYHFTLDQTFGKHAAKASSWTDEEERDFHYAAESIIWKFWNSRRTLPGNSDPTTQQFIDLINKHSGISFSVSGDGEFAQKFAGRQLPIEFDALITQKRPHFNVNVKKMLPGREFAIRPDVDWASMTINVSKSHTDRASVRQDGKGAATSTDFYYLPHEFGHAIGYGTDEYQVGAVARSDIDSLMNIGKEIRPRHLAFLKNQLNTMLKGVKFHLPPN
jgi:hypothetical protein